MTDVTDKPLYERIVFEQLNIGEKYFRENEETICKKLLAAARGMQKNIVCEDREFDFSVKPDLSGINKCLDFADNLMLLGTRKDCVWNTLKDVREHLPDYDPTTVVIVSCLHYLVRRELEKSAPESLEMADMKYVHERFDSLHWYVGEKGMHALGIKPMSEYALK